MVGARHSAGERSRVPADGRGGDRGVAARAGRHGSSSASSTPGDARAATRGLRNVTVAGGDGLLDIALAAVEQFAGSALFRDDAAASPGEAAAAQPGGGRLALSPGPAAPRRRDVPARVAGAWDHHPIPNLPPPDSTLRTQRAPRLSEEAPREELVRALADTLRRLQRIRASSALIDGRRPPSTSPRLPPGSRDNDAVSDHRLRARPARGRSSTSAGS